MNTYILHLETATKACSVALSNKGELVAKNESLDDSYAHGENLNLFIEEVLRLARIKTGDLAAISVTSGPGSYTGLRIGAATAKALCYALDIPLIAIDALKSLAEIARNHYPESNLCPLIDARRMEVYNTIYDQQGVALKPISADIIEADSYSAFEPFVYFGDGAEKLQEIWKGRNATIDTEIHSSAEGHVQLAYQKFKVKAFEDVAYWEPFYLKDFIAGKKS